MSHKTFPKPAPKPPARKRRMAARSEKGQRYVDELQEITPMLIARAHGMCECGCGREGQVAHHRKRRSQGGPNTLGNLLWLNDICHAQVHAHPEMGYRTGMLLRRDDEITTYPGANR